MYFSGVGWVRFEPTPQRRTGGELPSYTTQQVPQAAPSARPSAELPASAVTSAAPASSALLETVFSVPASESRSAADAMGPLVLQASGETWIEVVDGTNQVLLSRNLQAGETLSLDGALPTLYAATVASVPPGAYVGPSKRMETVGPPTLVKGSARSRDSR